jgi:hypothetical protein
MDQDERGGALQSVLYTDDLGAKALVLFQTTLQPGNYRNYGSNMTGFFVFCEENANPP